MKYNSPETEKNSKRITRSISSNVANEEKNSANFVNMDGVLFPAYDQGKFYKNNEDIILKEKIAKLEQE